MSWPWIVTRGRGKRPSGRPYCQACLAENRTPYFRIHWRLAWHTSCVRHGCTLKERCPDCGSPQQLHHLPFSARHVAACAACGADLRHVGTNPGRRDALEFQVAADRAVEHGGAECLGKEVDAAEWFRTADFFCRLVRRAIRSPADRLVRVLQSAGIEWPIRLETAPGSRIEHLDVEERQKVLGAVGRIMRLQEDTLRQSLASNGISRQAWRGNQPAVPETLVPIVSALPDHGRPYRRRPRRRPAGPRPRHEVRQMMKHLERRLEQAAQ